jgi:hypothetical protein
MAAFACWTRFTRSGRRDFTESHRKCAGDGGVGGRSGGGAVSGPKLGGGEKLVGLLVIVVSTRFEGIQITASPGVISQQFASNACSNVQQSQSLWRLTADTAATTQIQFKYLFQLIRKYSQCGWADCCKICQVSQRFLIPPQMGGSPPTRRFLITRRKLLPKLNGQLSKAELYYNL